MFSILLLIVFVCVLILMMGLFTVKQRHVAIIERLGKYHRSCDAGLHFRIPFVDEIAGTVSLKIQQLAIKVDTKTFDDVFVEIVTVVQFQVIQKRLIDSFYTLHRPQEQIESYIFDAVRAYVPKLTLDDLFSKKDEIANNVAENIGEQMQSFGYVIVKTLITDIAPDEKVKIAMNEINAAQRERRAALERAEAEKIFKVKRAEAEAESQILHGKGIAGARKEIIHGLKEAVEDLSAAGQNIENAISLLMMSQYFDTLKELGHSGKLNTVLVPHSPSSVKDIQTQIMEGILVAQNAKSEDKKKH